MATVAGLIGRYRRLPVENAWHEGVIEFVGCQEGEDGTKTEGMQWRNDAGVAWTVAPHDTNPDVLSTGDTNPYSSECAQFTLQRAADGTVTGFVFNTDLFQREADDRPVLIPAAKLKDYVTQCLVASGSESKRAALVAEVLVAADLRGIPSHGVNRLDLYCDELRRGAVSSTGEPTVVSDAPSIALVDGSNAQGPVVGKFCMELAMEKAQTTGCAWVVCNNSNHYGIAGYYAMLASARGLIGMSMTNTSPVCTPTRSKKAAIGTNPIACAAPTTTHPVVLDMATPTVPFGKVELKHRKGESCPDGWGVDADGAATTDPSKIIFGGGVTPLGGATELTGGHKGYGLGLMVEMLSGVLAGANVGPRLGQSMNPNAVSRKEPINLGQCFAAIDPAKFMPGYPERMTELADDMRGLPRAKADMPVLVPGDPEREATTRNMESGVPLHPSVAATLVKLGQKLNVPRPAAFSGVKAGKIWSGDAE